MGLSAWKAYRETRWALRVNPSSGNLHPTEAYIVHDGRIFHYAPREHVLEERAALPSPAWQAFLGGREGFLVALTSIQWREAWKYGERAFRYCQHDVGHAIAALRGIGVALRMDAEAAARLVRRAGRRLAGRGQGRGPRGRRARASGMSRARRVRRCRGATADPAPLVAASRARDLARPGKPPEPASRRLADHRTGHRGDDATPVNVQHPALDTQPSIVNRPSPPQNVWELGRLGVGNCRRR